MNNCGLSSSASDEGEHLPFHEVAHNQAQLFDVVGQPEVHRAGLSRPGTA